MGHVNEPHNEISYEHDYLGRNGGLSKREE